MNQRKTRSSAKPTAFRTCLAVSLLLSGIAGVSNARADDDDFGFGFGFTPGNLLVSRSVYDNNPNNVQVGASLPPNCATANCVIATANGSYPTVFNNDLVDGSFGITSKIFLDEIRPFGPLVNTLEVPNSQEHGISPTRDQMVTSFSSKSELALNLSTDGHFVTFMGYLAPVDAIDVSNSNTPADIDPTNPVPATNFRLVAAVDQHGHFSFTETNAYSGNNGRAAIMNEKNGVNLIYTSGNAGNGSNPQPNGIILGAGTQIMTAERIPLAAQNPGQPTPVGSFSVTQLGQKADKVGKDTNFRGLTIFNNVVYFTKGSGGNGINTVYFVDTTGTACPNGVGLPGATATLPTTPIAFNPAVLQTQGVTPFNMCILNGLPTTSAKTTTSFPFGIWFANAKTLYLADEGNGTSTFDPTSGTFTAAAAQTTAGLQKWVFDDSVGTWKLAYVLQAGLQLGVPYTVAKYPTGINPATSLPWSPATDGLRNLIGHVNPDGTATIWAITSTVSGSGDQGADPNKLVMITDKLDATSPPPGESFRTIRTAQFAEVLRGVSFTPGTDFGRRFADDDHDHDRH
jgi:hypothetical protein